MRLLFTFVGGRGHFEPLAPIARAAAADVAAATTAVLEQPSYREAAERVRAEIETLPGPDHAVALLNTLAS